jgi:hypothetical protein
MLIGIALFLGFSTIIWTGPIEDLKPGEWYEVPNSHLRDVAFEWPPGIPYTENGQDIVSVIDKWTGGAFDTKRNRLYVTGGGHHAYGGNELYAFDVDDLAWERVNDPYLYWRRDSCMVYYPDSSPAVGHTYGACAYIASMDLFARLSITKKNYYQNCPSIPRQAAGFDPASKTWHRLADTPLGGYINCGYDPVTEHVFAKGAGGSGQGYIAEFVPESGTWIQRSNIFNRYDYYTTVEVDPVRRLVWGIGEEAQWVLDISGSDPVNVTMLNTGGSQTIVNCKAPGLAYDPVSDKLVGWATGPDIYSLDLDTKTWTRHTATNSVNPGPPSKNYTFGRFRYVPDYNVFVVVNHVDSNVFLYKLTDAPSAPQWYLDCLDENKACVPPSAIDAGSSVVRKGVSIEAGPNPFSAGITIRIRNAERRKQETELKIYDANGKMVSILSPAFGVLNSYKWNASGLSAGIYLVKLSTGNASITKRLFLMK